MNQPGEFSARLLRWYDRARRELPWRLPPGAPADAKPEPFHVFVSEAMLQQTQVATVTPYFRRFVAAFPSFTALAAAPEQDVLRLWQGLGYYSRARNLRAAAIVLTEKFAGKLPTTVQALLTLPGVGRYTAGAVASIAFGERAAIVDGNVARVVCRLDRIESDPRDPMTRELLWTRAAEVLPSKRVGDFNSALMELGATVCTPRNPQCLICPVRANCLAFEAGVQDRIPLPRKSKPTPLHRRRVYCLRRPSDDRWLVEQRPAAGRWAGMWQFLTVDASACADDSSGDATSAATTLPTGIQLKRGSLQPLGTVRHALTHRRYHYDVFAGELKGSAIATTPADATAGRRWLTLQELDAYPLPKPHVRVVQMLAGERR